MKTLTLHIPGTVPDYLKKEVILPQDIATMIANYLERWGGLNMVVTAVPVFPMQAQPMKAPTRPATREEAAQKLSAVLASFAKELAELAAQGADEHSEAVAAHILTCLDCWYQARVPLTNGHYDRAIELAEVTQTMVDETLDMKQRYPAPVVPDYIWGDKETIA